MIMMDSTTILPDDLAASSAVPGKGKDMPAVSLEGGYNADFNGVNYQVVIETNSYKKLKQPGPLSLVEECRGSALIGRELHSVALPALLCHKEPARASKAPSRGTQRVSACSSLCLYGIRDRWLQCTERSYYRRPYAIKNQRGAR